MITQSQIMAAGKYVRGIKSPSKRVYAMSVMSWMLRQNPHCPERWELTAMAAQAVQHRLKEIIGEDARPMP